MRSITVEYQRYGDPTGILRLSDKYLRTVGEAGPRDELPPPLEQGKLDQAMGALDYARFGSHPTKEKVKRVRDAAADIVDQLRVKLRKFVPSDLPRGHKDGARYQIDIVAHPRELAQLPFEALEEVLPGAVITRRLRQPWAGPAVVANPVPRVLFASAQPEESVPRERHLEKLDEVLRDWGGAEGPALEVVENLTKKRLDEELAKGEYTHVHLLAHGIGPVARDPEARIHLDDEPGPTIFLALDDGDGGLDRCSPDELAAMFPEGVKRPATFAVGTCHSGEINSIRAGGTFAHVLHAAGIPVVVASQLALTKIGSDELITTFLRLVLDGGDPRDALRETRKSLRENPEETFYDSVALVGYIHLDTNLDEKEVHERKFKVELGRMKTLSREAAKAANQVESATASPPPDLHKRFASIRDRLERLKQGELTKKQKEELHGLQASSQKREAEAAWKLSRATRGSESEEWLANSRAALRRANAAYERASESSLDHHWVWGQWLALQAVINGTLADRTDDWIITFRAAERDAQATDEIWAWGTIAELHLLSDLVPTRSSSNALEEAESALTVLVQRSREAGRADTIESTLTQLNRYLTWWGRDDPWKLPPKVVENAAALHAHLTQLSTGD